MLVLTTIPLYYMSIFKALDCVCHEIMRIERKFMGMGLGGRCYVKIKIKRDSEIKDIKLFNRD